MFSRDRGTEPVTEAHMRVLLRRAHCRLLCRFDHVHAIDEIGNELHLCRVEQLALLRAEQFKRTLDEALASRID